MSVRIFGHYVSLPLLLLMLAETAIHVGVVYLATALRFLDLSLPLYFEGAPAALFPRALVYAATMMGIMTAFGLYGSALHKRDREYHARFLASFPAGAVAMAIIFYVVPVSVLGRGLMALSLLFSFILTAIAREVFFRVVGHEALKRRVLVLGSGSRAAGVEALLDKLGPNAGFHLVGFVQCGEGQPSLDKSKMLGDCTALRGLVEQYRVDEIVVGVRDRRNGHFPTSRLLECRLDGVTIVDLPTFFERETGYVQLNSLSASWMIFSEGFSKTGFQKVLKRVFDVSVSIGMLIATLPVILIAALAIWHETGRPVLYRQKRVGESGRIFEILKFRSMRVEAERDGVPRWAKKDDDRVTRVGRFLRMARIDELPQLINVLRGDMSFVGPRPERPPFVSELSRKVPFYASRHSVKPGITGWAQIRYPYGASVDDAVQKLQFDLYYVKNHSLFLDLVILLQTTQVVLFGQGAR
ncbi:MAG TPA: TIGR03013 family XrtA/PEP-CTERM system glycosyltransferase [Burkholderiales bacterium]|nr:TIGR03013 family XrtA/PEP-CTERM system glycosyltransferase [Burkholderiales bacterium]